MLSKQLTSRLKEEQERENQHNPAILNVNQADRLIRTVSCKHDTNHAIRKANINVLQSFDEIKLYTIPKPLPPNDRLNESTGAVQAAPPPPLPPLPPTMASEAANGADDKMPFSSISSTKLRRKNGPGGSVKSSHNQTPEIVEINLKDILNQMINYVSTNGNVNEWFALNGLASSSTSRTPYSGSSKHLGSTGNNLNVSPHHEPYSHQQSNAAPTSQVHDDEDHDNGAECGLEKSLFDSIENALTHIDFNLKRNSDFINELTKLLDTSRAIQQEKQLKKLLKSLEDEKNAALQPPKTPAAIDAKSPATENLVSIEEKKKQQQSKGKSFKGLTSFKSRSSSKENRPAETSNQPANQATPTSTTADSTAAKGAPNQTTGKEFSSSLSNLEKTFNKQLQLNHQNNEVSNSDYMELEVEVEKISFYLENLCQTWSKLCKARNGQQLNFSQFKYSVEFQSLLNNLNSNLIVKELEQSLFKLNWLVTSKSGFSEPNWKSTVLSLTPSTIDSFIGVNLLKNYYKYVKYDFVSYKLFTRQLQLLQICAIIMHIVHSILVFYRESMTVSSITSTFNGVTVGQGHSFNMLSDSAQTSLLSFSFSADKYRPISWSANHVTLYNVQSGKSNENEQVNYPPPGRKSTNLSRSSSTRRTGPAPAICYMSKEDHLKQVKYELFLNELSDFVKMSAQRLNIQASLANRTGYFYIVNQSTGLVLQAVDFTSEFSLKEQIEHNQKRIASSSIKAGSVGNHPLPATTNTTTTTNNNNSSINSKPHAPSAAAKGPRFYLMPKVTNATNQNNINKTSSNNNTVSSSLSVETANDEQLWYYYLINGCVANKIIRSGHCMAASSLNAKSPVTFWPNVKTTNCSWFFNHNDETIVSGLSDDLVLDYIIIDEPPNQRYAVVIDTKVPNKASQRWSFEFS